MFGLLEACQVSQHPMFRIVLLRLYSDLRGQPKRIPVLRSPQVPGNRGGSWTRLRGPGRLNLA